MSAQDTVFSPKSERIFDARTGTLIMGILNITPDSFFDGGKYTGEAEWLHHTAEMVAAGADIIDIGACSTRPGATEISAKEEEDRLIPAIRSVRISFPGIIISADTYRASVAAAAIAAGADMINDISGGTLDQDMFGLVAKLNVPYVLMHIRGTPKTMQQQPEYDNVVQDVNDFFRSAIAELQTKGFSKIILDPGFGFGKTVEHNFSLLRNLPTFTSTGYPVLAGISRKSMINKLLNIKAEDALNGTTVLNTIAVQNGAKILRVHDVREAKEVVTLVNYYNS